MTILFRLFGKRILKEHMQRVNNPLMLSEMEYRLTDKEGRKYFGFPQNVNMPVNRMVKMQEFLGLMAAGLSAKSLNNLLDHAEEAIADGLTNPKNAARAAAIIGEIRRRQEWIVPFELILNYLSVLLVREDESIDVVNDAIQADKVTHFRDNIKDYSFFFQSPELKRLMDSLNMSKEKFNEFLVSSQKIENYEKESLKILLSNMQSKPKENTSENPQ